MNIVKLILIISLIIIPSSFFTNEVSAQTCDTNCTLCSAEAACITSSASCEWDDNTAQCNPCTKPTEATWPTSPFGTKLTGCSDLKVLVKYLYEWGVFLGGMALFFVLLIGGFLYLTSAGDPAKMKDARDRISSALIGFVLLFSIYIILNIINPELVVLTVPSMGLGAPCDTDAECPGGSKCTDPNQGNGTKEGTCEVTIASFGCDRTVDCWHVECDVPLDCATGICTDQNQGDGVKEGKCQEDLKCTDKNQGDGEEEGMCISVCKKVVFYELTDFNGDCFEIVDPSYGQAQGCASQISKPFPTGCEELDLGITIKSVETEGNCMIYLFHEESADTCPADKTSLILGSSVDDIADGYGINPSDLFFYYAKIKEAGSSQ